MPNSPIEDATESTGSRSAQCANRTLATSMCLFESSKCSLALPVPSIYLCTMRNEQLNNFNFPF
jgi:hypothetical protein